MLTAKQHDGLLKALPFGSLTRDKHFDTAVQFSCHLNHELYASSAGWLYSLLFSCFLFLFSLR